MKTNKLFTPLSLLFLAAAVSVVIGQAADAQTQFVPSAQPQFTPNTQTQFVPSTKPQFTPNPQTQFVPSTQPQTPRSYQTGISNQNFNQNQTVQPPFQGSSYQQFPRDRQSFSQRVDATVLSGETFTGQFLPSQGAEKISAIVRSEVKATAYLDITDNTLDENNTVLGAVAVKLTPKQAQILALPAWVISIQGVRLRVVNEDSSFGNVKATITVVR
ncbi:MAG: hypothetical protein H7Y37_14175 [Anaerolineae bacterium]|nr:hypothetical protein [Gloeobacterales cyanobacterium ES-bin-313]